MEAKHTLPRVINYVITAGEERRHGIAQLEKRRGAGFWKLPDSPNAWHEIRINLAEAIDRASQAPGTLTSLAVDRWLLAIGVWCADSPGSRSGARFDDVDLRPGTDAPGSSVDGHPFDAGKSGFGLIVKPEVR